MWGDAPSTEADVAAAPTAEAERADRAKVGLATLITQKAELELELPQLEAAHKAAVERVLSTRKAVRAEIKTAESELDAAFNVTATELDAELREQHAAEEKVTALFSHEAELDVELSELEVAHKLAWDAAVGRVKARRKAVRAELKAANVELDAAVNAPVSGGRDPTEWLPDELIVMIMLMLPFVALWSGACERVCRRWNQLMESAPIVRRKREGRWAAYEAGVIMPQKIEGHTGTVWALAVGLDGKVYSGSDDRTIRVWSGESGAHLQTLQGHTNTICAIACGLNDRLFSGSSDASIRVWSSASGAHLQTLEGHTDVVGALAVGLDGKVYSGSFDCTVRVWSGDDGTHLQTLVGHTDAVNALAVGKDGAIYSGSDDCTIRVWSGEDGTHLRTLVGHTDFVSSLAVGLDGKVYSGSADTTVRVWSPDDGALLQTLTCHTDTVLALAVGPDGKVFSGSGDGIDIIRVLNGETGALQHTPNVVSIGSVVFFLAFGRDGTLYSGVCPHDGSGEFIMMWR
jgi:WD40 repeat protein